LIYGLPAYALFAMTLPRLRREFEDLDRGIDFAIDTFAIRRSAGDVDGSWHMRWANIEITWVKRLGRTMVVPSVIFPQFNLIVRRCIESLAAERKFCCPSIGATFFYY